MNLRWRLGLLLAASLMLALACQKKSDTPTGPVEGEVPAGFTRIAGAVKDASGAAVPNVALHVSYVLPEPARASEAADPLEPSTAILYNDQQVLTTACVDGTPLQDGVMVKLFWDNDGNGPDNDDPQPTLCNHPPECDDGPAGTANYNELPINGVEVELGAGLFYGMRSFTTLGDLASPSRYFGRIFCADGQVLWESDIIEIHGGYGEYAMTFHCTVCEGGPVVPAWQLSPSYPNPAEDLLVIRYSLLASVPVLLALHSPIRSFADTLFYQENVGTGSHERRVSLAHLARPPHNGLYTLRLTAGNYQADQALLRNVMDTAMLRGMDGIAVSGSDGAYTFDTAAGVSLRRYSGNGTDAGSVNLNRVRVRAIKPGYSVADTTFDVSSAQSVAFELRVTAQ